MLKQENTGFYTRFFGGFSLEFGGRRIMLAKNIKQKSMQILAILLKAGEEGVSRKRLVEMLEWEGGSQERDSWERKLNNLRRQTCKLRKIISESGFPEGEYIRISKNRYYFSMDYPVETDAEEFDRLYREARGRMPGTEGREGILREICRIYRGEFLPALVAEEWALVENAHYRSVYSRCVNELCQILKDRGDYQELLRLCTAASRIHPYDEWQSVQIDCLIADNRYREARKIQRQANELFSNDLGIEPFRRREGGKEAWGKGWMEDDERMAGLMPGFWDAGIHQGAYRCEYLQFIDVYRCMVRMSERAQVKLCLLLCTLKPEGLETRTEPPLPTGGLETRDAQSFPREIRPAGMRETKPGKAREIPREKMERFGKLLAESIRDSDVYTQCSVNQYLALLASFGETCGPETAGRLRREWKGFEESEGVRVELEMQELEPLSGKEGM